MGQNGWAPDGWEPDNSLFGKTSDAPCPPCRLCNKPMTYMFGLFGVYTTHTDTGEFLCKEDPITGETK